MRIRITDEACDQEIQVVVAYSELLLQDEARASGNSRAFCSGVCPGVFQAYYIVCRSDPLTSLVRIKLEEELREGTIVLQLSLSKVELAPVKYSKLALCVVNTNLC